MTSPRTPRQPVSARPHRDDERAALSLHDLVNRFQELSGRDLLAQAVTILIDTRRHDPARHIHPSTCPPLTPDEWIELLATATTIHRIVCHPAHLERALLAGVTWDQAATAMGITVTDARTRYREWAHRHPRPDSPQPGDSAPGAPQPR